MAALAEAKTALVRLDVPGALVATGKVRQEIGVPDSRASAMRLLEALRLDFFIFLETAPESARLHEVADEIEAIASLRDGDGDGRPLAAEAAASWARAWTYELRSNDSAAFVYRRSVCRDSRGRAEELGRRPAWTRADRVEAGVFVDCLADLCRSLRVMRPPEGPLSRQLTSSSQALMGGAIAGLVAHQDLSPWTARRALARLGFAAADAGDRRAAKKLLGQAKTCVPDHLRLARLEQPLIELELELAERGALHDAAKVRELFDDAMRYFAANGFVRRLEHRDWLWRRIEFHSHS